MKTVIAAWTPALLLGLGATFTVGVKTQREVPVVRPLAEVVPRALGPFIGEEVVISDAELAVAGVDSHLARVYRDPDAADSAMAFSIYVGYYNSQTQGRTIHSPKNCLPGSGWEPLAATVALVRGPEGDVPVNRYILQNEAQRALVLYWYQGRGRVAANEYGVKWDLLRDAALHGRTEEALVRVVVPVHESEDLAFARGQQVAEQLIAGLEAALPKI